MLPSVRVCLFALSLAAVGTTPAAAAAPVVVSANTEALAAATAGRARAPVVAELFTAQGCAACPEADAVFREVARRRGVIALTFPVDIWDYLGWADTGAKPEFTARQRAYIGRLKLREIYTPELVVNGRRETVGFDRAKVQALLASTPRARGPRVRFRSAASVEVRSGSAPPGGAEVWLARFDPAERSVRVTRGENRGKTVVQQNLVRELARLGAWSGAARRYALPVASTPGLRSAVLVQQPKGGMILAAAVR
jgi:hypothetical protein